MNADPEQLNYQSIRLLKDRVLIGQHANPGISTGGIHLPESAQQGQQMAFYVAAIGPDVKEVAIGDRVVMPAYFEHLTLEDGTNRKIVRESHILALFEESRAGLVAAALSNP